jgi:uncharacterized membrane protein YjjP (DUF1212 family)
VLIIQGLPAGQTRLDWRPGIDKLVDVNPDARMKFVIELARALHAYGSPAHRLEGAMADVMQSLGIEGTVFSLPTGIMISMEADGRHHSAILRVTAAELDLGRLSDLVDLSAEVGKGTVTPGEGHARIAAILATPPRYGTVVTVTAMALTSAAAARFFGGGSIEMAVALVIGLAVGLLSVAAKRVGVIGRLFDPIAGFVVSLLAVAAASLVEPNSIPVVTVAGLIILVPGLTLTTAISELAQQNLVSGTARLNGALITFLLLGFGVAAGARVAVFAFGTPAAALPVALPAWTEAVSVLVASVALTVIMRVPARDFHWVLLTAVTSYVAVRATSSAAGPELGVFVAALVAGAASNAHSRRFLRPAAVTRLPAIMLLVPGGLGFTGIASMLQQDVMEGVRTAFSVAIIAVSLVIGLIISNAIVTPGRKI